MTTALPATPAAPETDVLHPGHFAYRHIGPRREDLAEMLQTVGLQSPRRVHRRGRSRGDPAPPSARAAAGTKRAGGAPGAARPGGNEPRVPLVHRAGLRGHASRPRWSSGTCWRIPAGTPPTRRTRRRSRRAGSRRCSTSRRWCRTSPGLADRQRVAARRGHRGGRGDAPDARGEQRARRRRSTWSTSTAIRRRSRSCGRAPRRAASGWRWASPRRSRSEPGVIGALVQYPATDGAVRDFRTLVRAGARGGRAGHRGDRPAEPHRCWCRPASGAPTSRSATASASACRWGTAGRTRRSSPPGRRYKRFLPGRIIGVSQRPGRPAGAPDGAPDPRAAHPAGQGDEQRLHRAGAAGGDGEHVRGLSRPRRPAPDRRAGARARRSCWPTPCAGCATGWCTTRTSTRSASRCRSGPCPGCSTRHGPG